MARNFCPRSQSFCFLLDRCRYVRIIFTHQLARSFSATQGCRVLRPVSISANSEAFWWQKISLAIGEKTEILNFKTLPTFNQNGSRIEIFACFRLTFIVFGFQLRQNAFYIENCFCPIVSYSDFGATQFHLNRINSPCQCFELIQLMIHVRFQGIKSVQVTTQMDFQRSDLIQLMTRVKIRF